MTTRTLREMAGNSRRKIEVKVNTLFTCLFIYRFANGRLRLAADNFIYVRKSYIDTVRAKKKKKKKPDIIQYEQPNKKLWKKQTKKT